MVIQLVKWVVVQDGEKWLVVRHQVERWQSFDELAASIIPRLSDTPARSWRTKPRGRSGISNQLAQLPRGRSFFFSTGNPSQTSGMRRRGELLATLGVNG